MTFTQMSRQLQLWVALTDEGHRQGHSKPGQPARGVAIHRHALNGEDVLHTGCSWRDKVGHETVTLCAHTGCWIGNPLNMI